jgi:hypothetical protein
MHRNKLSSKLCRILVWWDWVLRVRDSPWSFSSRFKSPYSTEIWVCTTGGSNLGVRGGCEIWRACFATEEWQLCLKWCLGHEICRKSGAIGVWREESIIFSEIWGKLDEKIMKIVCKKCYFGQDHKTSTKIRNSWWMSSLISGDICGG